MKRMYLLFTVIASILLSCSPKAQESKEIEVIKSYYKSINSFDLVSIPDYYYDSVRMRENDYFYVASKDSFYVKLQWDSVFRPKYAIIEIEEVDDGVIVEVSKVDPRILFLNEEPTIYREHFIFKDDHIYSSEIQEFILFNWDTWDKNRSKLVEWTRENHPEFDGFIHDQTKQGALNYIEAMKLFTASRQGE